MRTRRWMPSSAKANDHMRAQQHDVLAGHGHDVQQPAAAEVLDQRRVDALVVAEDHALQHLGDRRVHAGGEVGARRQPEPVDEPLQAAAAAADRQVGEVAVEQDVLSAAPQVAAVVEGAGLGLGQRLDARRGQAQHGALGERPDRVVRRASAPPRAAGGDAPARGAPGRPRPSPARPA